MYIPYMDVTEALLDSWDRQCRIVNEVATLVTEETRKALPSPDGWPLDQHLAHMHSVRRYFIAQLSPERQKNLSPTFTDGWVTPISDLDEIKKSLKASGEAVREAVKEHLKNGVQKAGWYDNPVLYLQHMVWHDGWHVGLIFLGLRLAGHEVPEEWEETKVWGEWRTEEW